MAEVPPFLPSMEELGSAFPSDLLSQRYSHFITAAIEQKRSNSLSSCPGPGRSKRPFPDEGIKLEKGPTDRGFALNDAADHAYTDESGRSTILG